MLYEVITAKEIAVSVETANTANRAELYTPTADRRWIVRPWTMVAIVSSCVAAAIIVITSYSIHYTKLYEDESVGSL